MTTNVPKNRLLTFFCFMGMIQFYGNPMNGFDVKLVNRFLVCFWSVSIGIHVFGFFVCAYVDLFIW